MRLMNSPSSLQKGILISAVLSVWSVPELISFSLLQAFRRPRTYRLLGSKQQPRKYFTCVAACRRKLGSFGAKFGTLRPLHLLCTMWLYYGSHAIRESCQTFDCNPNWTACLYISTLPNCSDRPVRGTIRVTCRPLQFQACYKPNRPIIYQHRVEWTSTVLLLNIRKPTVGSR